MKKIIPVILALVGVGSGVGAGIFLKPAAMETTVKSMDCAATSDTPVATLPVTNQIDRQSSKLDREYVKMSNQFVVPIVNKEKISGLVVLSLSIEVTQGYTGTIYQFEPKLRDGFLQVFFDHANVGGFRGAFTESGNMAVLRRALLESAQRSLGGIVTDVLITEIVRQDS